MTEEISKSEIKLLDTILNIEKSFQSLSDFEMSKIKAEESVIVIIDVINGFIKKGNLADPKIMKIVGPIAKLLNGSQDFLKLFFVDEHTDKSVELETYPNHCLKGTDESDIVEELKPYMGKKASVIPKNSTNGFHTEAFQYWLEEHEDIIKNVIIVGNCTDICVRQFAITLKTAYNEWNESLRVIVPINAVDTFELSETNHNARLMNCMSLYDMQSNGIELFKSII